MSDNDRRLESELNAALRLSDLSTRFIKGGSGQELYGRMLDTAMAIMHSDFASMQMLEGTGENGAVLHLLAWKGFHPESARFWNSVTMGSTSSCGEAMRRRGRFIIADTEQCQMTAGTPDLEEYRRSGIRSVQSTPLISRSGQLLGMISTHWRQPHEPAEKDLYLFDILARQAADLIEHNRAEEALRESQERLRLAMQGAATGAWEVDLETGQNVWDQGMPELLGLPEHTKVETKRWIEYVHHDDREHVIASFRAASRKGEQWSADFRVVRADGTIRWINSRGTFVKTSSGKLKAIGVAQDITERKRAEEALFRSQSKLLRAEEIAGVGNWEWNIESGECTWSGQIYRMFDVDKSTRVTHELFMNNVHPDFREGVERAIESALLGEKPYDLEYQIMMPCLTAPRWIHVKGDVIFNENGRPVSMIGTAQDITDRKRAEQELRKAKDELEDKVRERTSELKTASLYARSLIEASIDPLVTISAEGKITDVNRASEKATGFNRKQLIGSDFSNYFTEPERARAGYEEVFRKGAVRDYALELKHRDGHTTPVLYNASVYRDETGRIRGVFAAARDITQRKRAEETANAERQRFYDVLETMPIFVILLTPDYQVTFANRFFRERFGKISGQCCYEYLFKRKEPCKNCQSHTVLKSGKSQSCEWTGPDKRKYEIFKFPFRDTDGSPLLLKLGIDITKRKEMEIGMLAVQRKLRAMASDIINTEERSRQNFATDLHDTVVQTLGAAKLRLQLIQDQIPPEAQPIFSELQQMLTQSIREARQVMAEMSPPVLYELGFVPALEWLTEQMENQHGFPIFFEKKNATGMLAHEIEVLLFQATRELLMNTIKHSKAERATVRYSGSRNRVRIEVIDNGIGLDRRKVFRTDPSSGGFGLFSIRERLRHVGGRLTIRSKPGRGTQVIIIAPLRIEMGT